MKISRRTALKGLGGAAAAASVFSPSIVFSKAKQIKVQVNTTMKPGGSEEAGIKMFKEVLDKTAPGRFDVVPFMSGQLGGENAVLELLNIGETQISLTGGNWRSQYAPKYDPVSIPFLFPSGKAVEAFMGTESGKKLTQIAADKGGIVHFGAQMRAPRHMTSNKAINSPADLKGFRLRLPAIPVWVDVWSSLGAQTVIVPAPEIYLAMQTGQVDGHENSLVSPYARKLHEVQSHLVMTGHVHFPWHWMASKKWFDGLDGKEKKLIDDAIQIARAHGTKVEAEKDKFYLKELKKKGMKIIEPDVQKFKDAAKPAIDKAMGKLADGVLKDIEAAIASVK